MRFDFNFFLSFPKPGFLQGASKDMTTYTAAQSCAQGGGSAPFFVGSLPPIFFCRSLGPSNDPLTLRKVTKLRGVVRGGGVGIPPFESPRKAPRGAHTARSPFVVCRLHWMLFPSRIVHCVSNLSVDSGALPCPLSDINKFFEHEYISSENIH